MNILLKQYLNVKNINTLFKSHSNKNGINNY